MPRPSPDLVAGNNRPDGLPARLVIFGAAQGMGRWLAEQVFANVALQLVLVDEQPFAGPLPEILSGRVLWSSLPQAKLF